MVNIFDKNNIEDIYSLSPLQEAIYSYREMNPSSGAYHCQMSYRVKGNISIPFVGVAFQEMFDRYEILRTVFVNRPNGLLQVSLKKRQVTVYFEDVTDKEDNEAYVGLFRSKEKEKQFDLKTDVLMRLSVLRVSEKEFEFIWSYHHILIDGWSSSVLLSDYNNIYYLLSQGLPVNLPVRRPFKEYITWLSSKDQNASKLYWRNYLMGYDGSTTLNVIKKDSSGGKFEKKECSLRIHPKDTSKLLRIAERNGVTMNSILHSAWSVLLNKYTGRKDVLFGSVVSGRPPEIEGVEAMVGLFINTIPVRVTLDENMNFQMLLASVHEKSSNHNFHNLSFGEIQSQGPSKDLLFDHILVFENYPAINQLEGLTDKHKSDSDERVIVRFESSVQNNYDFYLNISLTEELTVNFNYNRAVFEDESVERMMRHFEKILLLVAENYATPLKDLTLMRPSELLAVKDFGLGQVYEFVGESVHDQFIHQALLHPDGIALVEGSERLTYREVNHRSDCIADFLLKQGVHRGEIIGLLLKPGHSMWVFIAGILKSGCAYLPLDPDLPASRIEFIIKDSGLTRVLCSEDSIGVSLPNVFVYTAGMLEGLYSSTPSYLRQPSSPEDLCYVIYTSGSTGTPKGVMITHGNILNYSFWFIKRFGIGFSDSSVLTSSYSFDLGYSSVYPVLLGGGTLHFLRRDEYLDSTVLVDYVSSQGITYLKMTPTLFSTWVNSGSHGDSDLPSLRLLLLGGEPIRLQEVRTLQERHGHIQVMNHYGPTETTVGVIVDEVVSRPKEFSVRTVIGRAIYNTEVLILDSHLRRQPVGIPGEICIGGQSVGRGYMNSPEQTARQFVVLGDSGIIYRTGDMGRMLEDGRVEYMGRTDHQFKIRGYRVDIREIEQGLQSHPLVEKAVALVRSREGVLNLCGYIVLRRDSFLKTEDLRTYLQGVLADYMIPSELYTVSSIPMRPNGKVDATVLLQQQPEVVDSLDGNKTEGLLSEIWKQVLGIPHVGLDENFFTIGGDSIKAIKLAARINKEFSVKIPLPEIFEAATLRQLQSKLVQLTMETSPSIEVAQPKKYYPLSSAQKRMFFLQSMDPESTVYNMPQVLILRGSLDKKRLTHAFLNLIKRHEILRTNFTLVDGEPFQEIRNTFDFSIEEFSANELESKKIISGFVKAFDLRQSPLIRVALITVSPTLYFLLIDVHHIVADGESIQILKHDFEKFYAQSDVSPLRFQYKDYTEWLHHPRSSQRLLLQREYWLKQFGDEVPVLNLPIDFRRPPIQTYQGRKIYFSLGTRETKLLKKLSLQNESTVNMSVLSLYYLLLYNLSGSDDIVVGTPVLGRRVMELEGIAGMFVNTLALRIIIKKEEPFSAFLKRIKNQVVQALHHQEYPYEELVEAVSKSRDMSRNPLFDTMFTFKKYAAPTHDIVIDGLEISSCDSGNFISKFDLTLDTVELEDSLNFSWEYNNELFEEETIRVWQGYLSRIIEQVISYPDKPVGMISILSDEQNHQFLERFSNTGFPLDDSSVVLRPFVESVHCYPHKVAIVQQDKSITYEMLDFRSSQLASHMVSIGIGNGLMIGVIADRSIELLVGIWAILKTGNAFFALDPAYPSQRINFMIRNAGSNIILVTQEFASVPEDEIQKIILDDESLYQAVPNIKSDLVTPRDVAYLVYTSGSTGVPKGVMIEHRSWYNARNAWRRVYRLDSFDIRLLQLVSISFDVFCGDVARSLMNGGTMILASEESRRNPESLYLTIKRNKVTLFEFTPGIIIPFLQYVTDFKLTLNELKLLIFGSEPLLIEEYLKVVNPFNNQFRIANSYGVSEATVDSSVYECGENLSGKLTIPIGKPIDNTIFYVLDQSGKIVPAGIVGELYIGGAGLARGYLNNVELTQEKFVVDPFQPEHKVYKTGDLVRWLRDGNVEFLGRYGTQVKVRGYRIELSEIENCLSKHPAMTAAVVETIEDKSGGKHLIAFVIFPEHESLEDLKTFLREYLPLYMIPDQFIRMDTIPLTTSGKINRKQLVASASSAFEDVSSYVAPYTQLQREIASLWEEALGRDRVGVTTDFFELGGNSLVIIKLVARIHATLNKKLKIIDFFTHPTVEKQATHLKSIDISQFIGLQPAASASYYSLAPAQRRLYILQQMDLKNTAYNMTDIVVIDGLLEKEKIERIFQLLVQRHESLRTAIIIINDQPYQRIVSHVPVQILFRDVNEDEVDIAVKDFIQPFDLEKPSQFRVGILSTGGERHVMIIDMHHIISDGVSHEILMRDFIALYKEKKLEQLRLQYKDFVVWLNSPDQQQRLKLQEAYWLKEFESEAPLLELPTDFNRPAIQRFEGKRYNCVLNTRQTKALKVLARSEKVTLYTLLLSIYYVLLYKLTGQEDIIVGTPVVGRRHVDLQGIVGIFVNMLSLRNFPKSEFVFSEFLQLVKSKNIGAFENQEYEYEDLVEKTVSKRDLSRNPVFTTVFTLGDDEGSSGESEIDLNLSPYSSYQNVTSKFDLALHANCIGEEISIALEYSTSLFKEQRIMAISEYFSNCIDIITGKPDIRLRDIQILSKQEREKVIEKFNNTQIAYSDDKTLSEIFELMAASSPDLIACSQQFCFVSYDELNKRSNQLAHYLNNNGVGRTCRVGILMNRRIEMIIAMMGILKSGALYVPVEPDLPPRRVQQIFDSVGVIWIITNELQLTKTKNLKEEIPSLEGIVCLDLIDSHDETTTTLAQVSHMDLSNPDRTTTSDDLAYVIHTSGSTGLPKGVAVKHKPVVNLIEWITNTFHINSSDKILFVSSISFDLSVYDVFGILSCGGTICIASEDTVRDGRKLLKSLAMECITFWDSAPAALQQVLPWLAVDMGFVSFKRLRIVFQSGDWIPLSLHDMLTKNFANAKLIALGGATEAAIWSNYFPVKKIEDSWRSIPYGKPIQNAKYFILDSALQPCPVGVSGDLYIGGECLASGYFNEPELTASKFIADPFDNGGIIYRTGDCARWFEDGNIEFLGRKDSQVKIRGMRIELGEIQNQLRKHPDIEDAIVVTSNDKEDKYLIAYYISKAPLTSSELKSILTTELPSYMIPSHFIRIETFPVTANGKLDRKALPIPEIFTAKQHIRSTNETEKILLSLFSELLNIEETFLGTESDFFEMGGHSLKATQLLLRISKIFSTKLDLRDIFLGPSVMEIARKLSEAPRTEESEISPLRPMPWYEMSHAQKGVWLACQVKENMTAFNISMSYDLEGNMDVFALKKSFHLLIERYEILRTTFLHIHGDVHQKVNDFNADDFNLEVYDFTHMEIDKAEEENRNIRWIYENRSFDLATGPLIRMGLVTMRERHVLTITIHHIITDGWSMEIMFRELIKLYNAIVSRVPLSLEPLKIQYKEYAAWHNEYVVRQDNNVHRKYWLSQFDSIVPPLLLPTDGNRTTEKKFRGERQRLELAKEKVIQLRSRALQKKTTLFSMLFACVEILLYKYSGQEDIVIGVPVAGRSQMALEDQIGLFVNTLPIRVPFSSDDCFNDMFEKVKQTLITAFNHQTFPFDQLVDELDLNVEPGRSPLFDVLINFHTRNSRNDWQIDGLRVAPLESEVITSKYDMSFNFFDDPSSTSLTIEYNSELYKKETIDRLSRNLLSVIDQVLASPESTIAKVSLHTHDHEDSSTENEFLQSMRNM